MNDGLGLWLRRARENQQLSLPDVEKALRIRRRYLQALEVGDYTALPGEIQARGFLRNYARFLHLPVEEALARYDAELQGHPVQPRSRPVLVEAHSNSPGRPTVFAPPPSEAEEVAQVSSGVPRSLFMILIAVIAFFVLVVIGSFIALQFLGGESGDVTPSLAATSDMPSETAPAGTLVPTAFPVVGDGKVRVRLVAKEHAWVSVSADDEIIFQGIATPEQVLEAAAGEILIVSTGNGGAFQISVNGGELEDLGAPGEVVRRAWSPDGEIPMGGM
ncbi:MAG: helix-turn-helix domain-containing protein [Anaerolineae bacterium]|nr:helix-turn-helix domain-containing protein [Anaerolineae bacterium]